MKNEKTLDFIDLIKCGSASQLELFEVYKSSIGLINNLKNRSKKYMSLLSDVEVSLSGDASEIDDTFTLLTKNIESFNLVINQKREAFAQVFEEMLNYYNLALNKYELKEGQLTKLLESRRQLLFLRTLIRKYKFKINSLQLMNNALLSHSVEFENAKDTYKQNLIQLSTAMTKFIEVADDLIKRIDLETSSV